MEKELQQKLEEIAFKLQRLTDDYHELLNEIAELKNVEESKRVLYEQHVTTGKMPLNYIVKSRINKNTKIINYVKSHIKDFGLESGIYEYKYTLRFELARETSKIIETYIPSKNLVLVVEL